MYWVKRTSITITVFILGIVMTVFPLMNVGAVYYFNGEKMIADSGYKYYRAWSQDQFPWHNTKPSDAWESDWMNRYGCSTVAMAKMFVEAGVANPSTVNPGTLMSKYGSPSKGIGDVGIYWSTLAGQFGMTCESFQYYPTGSFYNTAMSFFNRKDHQYHLLLKVTLSHGGSHYVQVDRQATIDSGEIVYNDSTNTSDGGTRYNSASAYYNAISLQKLSKSNYTANYFVVFYTNATLKMKNIVERSSTSAQIYWYPNGSCQNYLVFRRKKGETSWSGKRLANVKHVAGEGIRSYTDNNLVTGTTYEYTVRGYYTVGGTKVYTGYNKTGLSVTTHADAPKLKSAVSVDHKTIKVTWSAVKNADGYKIYRRKSTSDKWTALDDDVKQTSFTDTTAVCGEKYYYTVRAYIGQKNFLGAYDQKGISGVAVPKEVVLDKTESLDFNSIKITWNKVSGVSGYCIYRKGGTDKTYKKIGTESGANTTTFTDMSAICGQTYTYTVRAYKTVNSVDYLGKYNSAGITGKAITKATASTKYTSSAYDKIKLEWEAVNGATGYAIYRKAEGESSYKKVATINGNGNVTYTDKNLKCCVKYLYRVRGYRTVNGKNYEGAYGTAIQAYTKPAKPKLTSTQSIGYNTIQVNWNQVEGATGYTLYRKTTGKYTKLLDITGKTKTACQDQTAVTGEKYTYTVRAFCKKGDIIKYSSCGDAITGTAYPAQAQTVAVKSLSYNSTEVMWKAVDGASGYNIYRKKATDKSYKLLGTTLGRTNVRYVDSDTECGIEYYYTIKAFRTESNKNYYGPVSAVMKGKSIPSAPAVKVSNRSYNSLNISWNKVSGADGYRIYYKKGTATNWTRLTTFDNADLTSFYQTSLTTGTKYTYTVRAYHKVGNTKCWGAYNNTGVSDTPVTTAPKLTSAKSINYRTIRVNWNTVAGANGYRVYRKTPNSSWVAIATIKDKSVLSYDDETVSCGIKYTYTVRAYRTVGKSNIYGKYNGTGVSATAVPETPILSLSSISYNRINVTWSKCLGADGYKVYRKPAGGTYSHIKTVTTKGTYSFYDTVSCGVEYTYYVTAYATVDKVEYGSYSSNEKSCKAVPATPTITSVTAGTKKATVSWESVAGASGYYVYRKEGNETFKLIYDAEGNSTKKFTDTGLETGKKYIYTVKAYTICPAGYITGGYNKTGVSVTVK
ncbi:MAG: fibronectin type III domain-containing protein [Ruminococcus sp.]